MSKINNDSKINKAQEEMIMESKLSDAEADPVREQRSPVIIGDLELTTADGTVLRSSTDLGLAWAWAEHEHGELWEQLSYGQQVETVSQSLAELRRAARDADGNLTAPDTRQLCDACLQNDETTPASVRGLKGNGEWMQLCDWHADHVDVARPSGLTKINN